MISQFLLICSVSILILRSSYAELKRNFVDEENALLELLEVEKVPVVNDEIEKLILNIEVTADYAEKMQRNSIVPIEEIEDRYDEMVDTLQEIIDTVRMPTDAIEFLYAKGISRVVSRNINNSYGPFKRQLLILIKTIFDSVPKSQNVLPVNIVDKLLDIFENSDNLALKAHALDILYVWLPENPKLQARVMKLKGLEPFYQQINKLDTFVVNKLLDLFNKILEEHLEARKEKPKNKADYEKLKFYQRIGLIERMSTPVVCVGLLNIFESIWTYSTTEKQIDLSVFKLIKNVKPFCLATFQRKSKSVQLFDKLLKYIANPENKSDLFIKGLNITDMEVILKEYVDELKNMPMKDEF